MMHGIFVLFGPLIMLGDLAAVTRNDQGIIGRCHATFTLVATDV